MKTVLKDEIVAANAALKTENERLRIEAEIDENTIRVLRQHVSRLMCKDDVKKEETK